MFQVRIGSSHHHPAQRSIVGVQVASFHHDIADLRRGERAQELPQGFQNDQPGVALGVIEDWGDLVRGDSAARSTSRSISRSAAST